MLKSALIRLIILALASASPSWALDRSRIPLQETCNESLGGLTSDLYSMTTNDEGKVFINKILVTGSTHYPLELVENNLRINNISAEQFSGKTILTVAEGFSGLLPALVKRYESSGAVIFGLDLWYNRKIYPDTLFGHQMSEYQNRYAEHLVAGSAFELPVQDASIDFLFSHLLVNNILYIESLTFMKEAVRVLSIGGEARIAGFNSYNVKSISEQLYKLYGDSIKIEVTQTVKPWNKNMTAVGELSPLLVLTKLKAK